jgi:hypothetical protein
MDYDLGHRSLIKQIVAWHADDIAKRIALQLSHTTARSTEIVVGVGFNSNRSPA